VALDEEGRGRSSCTAARASSSSKALEKEKAGKKKGGAAVEGGLLTRPGAKEEKEGDHHCWSITRTRGDGRGKGEKRGSYGVFRRLACRPNGNDRTNGTCARRCMTVGDRICQRKARKEEWKEGEKQYERILRSRCSFMGRRRRSSGIIHRTCSRQKPLGDTS